jgi:hypothetical protein
VAGGVRLLKGPLILSAREADALRQLATLVERIVNPPKGNVVALRRPARRPRSSAALRATLRWWPNGHHPGQSSLPAQSSLRPSDLGRCSTGLPRKSSPTPVSSRFCPCTVRCRGSRGRAYNLSGVPRGRGGPAGRLEGPGLLGDSGVPGRTAASLNPNDACVQRDRGRG